MEQPQPAPKSQRVRDIEEALRLAGRPVASQMLPSQSQTPRPGSEKRLQAIKDALSAAGKDIPSQTSQTNVLTVQVTSLKRTSCTTPESPPNAKRRHVSPHWLDSSPLPSPTISFGFSSGSLTTNATPEPMHSSPSPEPMAPPPLKEVPRRHATYYTLPSNIESHFKKFFSEYPGFRFSPSTSATAQFHHMRDNYSWSNRRERDAAREGFNNALSQTFNSAYGTEVQDLKSWQNLCEVLEIKPIPGNLELCQDEVLSTHVNIVDLIETPITGKSIRVFASEKELSVYTKAHNKFFPRDDAYASGLLKFLLRQILNPPSPSSTRRRWWA